MHKIHPDLRLYNKEVLSSNESDIFLFAMVKNEMLRLPYFLSHYRNIGVDRFFIIDNGSTDDTSEYLKKQGDVVLFTTNESYAKARQGIDWINSLISCYALGHWALFADADELFIYPGYEKASLKYFVKWLDSEGADGVFAIMLDMYSEQPINNLSYKAGTPFLETCNWFDSKYWKYKRPYLPFMKPRFPEDSILGGPRVRHCYPYQDHGFWPIHWSISILHAFWKKVIQKTFGIKLSFLPHAPISYKIPLVKWQNDRKYLHSHSTTRMKLSSVQASLLHFKYFQDFSEKVNCVIKAKSHYNGSAEYKRYAKMLLKNDMLTFKAPQSMQLNESSDLTKLGHMIDNPDWKKIYSKN